MNLAYLVLAASLLVSPSTQVKQDLVNLRRIGPMPSKGRVQDQQLSVVEALIKAGPPAVTFLVSKLDDRTRIAGQEPVMDFWPRVEVRHVALVVLCDLLTRADEITPTVPGFTWVEILDAHDPNLPAWEVYDRFVAQHGRSAIRRKVEQLLKPYSGALVWDATERCFRPRG